MTDSGANLVCHDFLSLCFLQVSIVVQPGKCMQLEVKSTPYYREGYIPFAVPLSGSVALWLQDAVVILPDEEKHYNWNVPVQELIKIAEVF